LEQIMQTFGDIYEYIRADGTLDPRWYTDFLVRAPLQFALRLAWDRATSVSQITCHKLLAEQFSQVFAEIRTGGLEDRVSTLGGCFAFRQQRTGSKLSTHAWGIAIDLNPESNQQGTEGDMNRFVVEIFRAKGFTWGGDFSGHARDPMHFQFCTGY